MSKIIFLLFLLPMTLFSEGFTSCFTDNLSNITAIPGTINSGNYLHLSIWQTGLGGNWENWSINNGVFIASAEAQSNFNLDNNSFLNDVNNAINQSPLDHLIKIYDTICKMI